MCFVCLDCGLLCGGAWFVFFFVLLCVFVGVCLFMCLCVFACDSRMLCLFVSVLCLCVV